LFLPRKGGEKQLAKIHSSSLNTAHLAFQNIGFIFDEHLTFAHKISSLSKSCYYLILWWWLGVVEASLV